jgi:hypothetical protein
MRTSINSSRAKVDCDNNYVFDDGKWDFKRSFEIIDQKIKYN